MKHFTKCFLLVLVLLSISGFSRLNAQNWDYLDVAQGYETLNIAVESDTTATGQPVSLNRVYRLARGGVYLLNGTLVNNSGAPLRIFAEEGSGAKPLVIMAADQSGASGEFAALEGDGHFKNIYISGTNNLGNYNRYTMRLNTKGIRVVLDGVQVDGAYQAHVRTYAEDCKIYFMNCEFRNGIDQNSSGNGRFFDSRGLMPDSLFLQNNTFYVNMQRALRLDGALVKNLILDHNTFYLNMFGSNTSSGTKQSGPLEIGKTINARITNNLFMNMALEAMRHLKTVTPPDRIPIIHIDSLQSTDYTEQSRTWVVKNNAYGWSQPFKDFWATIDTVKAPTFISPYGLEAFFNSSNTNLTQSNNFEELVAFSNAPAVDDVLNFVKYRYSSNFTNVGNPNPRADENGVGALDTNPGSFGPGPNEFKFDYATTHTSYTAGDGGFPLGDLNWFPDKKAAWIASGGTDVEDGESLITSYTLEQNYPNPFNPSTKISYSVPKLAKVNIAVYNSLGQKVTDLVNSSEHMPGNYSVVWNGKDSSGKSVSSGVYFYQLSTDVSRISKKMVLIK